ncbi:MAG: choice-of-anchor J domain-containing protein, partial [Thermoplasmatota archaeon]
ITFPDGTFEGFEGPPPQGWPPTGWSEVDYTGNDTYHWFPDDSYSHRPPDSTGYYANVEVPSYGDPSYDARMGLFSSSLDLTGMLAVTLEFDHFYDDWYTNDNDYGQVRVYSDGVLEEVLATYGGTDHKGHAVLSFNPSGYTNPANVTLEFYYTTGNFRGYSWGIDNVLVRTGGMVEVFQQTVTTDLPRYSVTNYVEFGPWTPTLEGDYTITVKTELPGDEGPLNDQQQKQILMKDIHNVVVTDVNYPQDGSLHPTGQYAVNATVANLGNTYQTDMPVNLTIYDCAGPTTVIDEGFEAGSLPAGWTTIDGDGDGYDWEIYSSSTYAHSGTYSARTERRSVLGNDDYLVLPQISIPSGALARFSFWTRGYSAYRQENMSVMLSTTGNDKADFTTVLDDISLLPSSYGQYVYDLTPWAGQDVYVAIVCTSEAYSSTLYRLYVDDILVDTFTGITEVFTDEVAIDIDPGESQYVEFSPWNADTEGSYVLRVEAVQAQDKYPGNNALLSTVDINDIDDVGPTAITYPHSPVSTGSYAINATIHNFGNYDMTKDFNVTASVYKLVGGGVKLYEGFEDPTFPPPGWMVYDDDGGSGRSWDRYASSTYAHTGSACARALYDFSSYRPNDDWLVTPAITIPDDGVFEYWARTYSSSTAEQWEVYYTTTGNTIGDFLDHGTLLGSYDKVQTTYELYQYDMSAEAGNDVWFGFRYLSDYAWYLYVDDVSVWAQPEYVLVGTDTQTVMGGVPLGQDVYVEFDPIAFSEDGDYVIEVETLLASDENTSNDVFQKEIHVEDIPDVGVKSVNYPANQVVKLQEDFNGALFPPTGWRIINYCPVHPAGTW